MLKFIDLFAGAGGLSEGFYQEDFKSLVHVEIDKHACETLRERMRFYDYNEDVIDQAVLNGDMTDPNIIQEIERRVRFVENELRRANNLEELGETDPIDNIVDVVVGGPPCQSFSTAGRARDPHGMRNDPRNFLFENYINILEHFQPKIFVFENVVGLLSATVNNELVINTIFERMNEAGYNVLNELELRNNIVLNSVHYGVPQTRKRVIIIGVRNDLNINPIDIYRMIEKTHYGPDEEALDGLIEYVKVRDAIADLPRLNPGQGEDDIHFIPQRLNDYTQNIRDIDFDRLYNHMARNHNDQDIQRYTLMSANEWTLRQLLEHHPELDNGRAFGNSYVVQNWGLPGRTIIAHLYKDGNQFIHPDHTQGRTFTVREAARIQSFPDNFRFMGSRTQQFKQVGNAVPPIMARSIAMAVNKALEKLNQA
ncbi:DNA-cytosine methyltransferase,Modification methylase BspRI,DNA cytosine methylase,DNA (cytosine-5-)-methyltransferase,C-5 cytosine-specific DNA methylase [[Clostridium] sordellii]|uniref:DNA cytosine methyltransferase n=1 Tax=Paraclostridium sordellii TaxID=1505 RepID=UPI0005433967|nr:DNA cytosine methyltransferase [Paeniclostridium sordellii]CEK34521.1 DNA-cytosine methyltransferase,Modification methylase BspRI,DNA cytosine methylase,DNA (cytosine-5-)-methyltransferase,C-5 cytosine-specific DNA methylase [[Clostridium] sordellii] [Paeniclostridium sordellii]